MRRVRGVDTKPELALRRVLWARRWRYRLHQTQLPGKPDIVYHRRRIVVFIDGEYWHSGQWERRGWLSLAAQVARLARAEYWEKKISSNAQRDLEATSALLELGWIPMRFWASDVLHNTEACADRVIARLMNEGAAADPRVIATRRRIEFDESVPSPPVGSIAGWKPQTPDDRGSATLRWCESPRYSQSLNEIRATSRDTRPYFWAIRAPVSAPLLSLGGLDELTEDHYALDLVDLPSPENAARGEKILIGRPKSWTTPLERGIPGKNSLHSIRSTPICREIDTHNRFHWNPRPLPNRPPSGQNPLAWFLKHYFDPILTEAVHESFS